MPEYSVWIRFEVKATSRVDAEKKISEALENAKLDIPYRIVLKFDASIRDRANIPIMCVDDALYERLCRT